MVVLGTKPTRSSAHNYIYNFLGKYIKSIKAYRWYQVKALGIYIYIVHSKLYEKFLKFVGALSRSQKQYNIYCSSRNIWTQFIKKKIHKADVYKLTINIFNSIFKIIIKLENSNFNYSSWSTCPVLISRWKIRITPSSFQLSKVKFPAGFIRQNYK